MLNPQQKYDLNNTIKITLKLNLKTDADIISALGENKQGSVKQLIRKGIEK